MGSSFSTLVRKMMGKKEMRVLILGLDAAGKTTTLYKLKLGEVITTIPTIGFNVETIEYKNVSLTAWDVGGRSGSRALWRHYYQNTQAVIFVVDSNDRERIQEIRNDVHQLMAEDELRDAVILVFANKQDLSNAMSREEVQEQLGLSKFRHHQWAVFGCCAMTGDGLYEGLDWLTTTIAGTALKKAVTAPVEQTAAGAKDLSGRLFGPAAEWLKQIGSGSWWSQQKEVKEQHAGMGAL